MARKNRIIENIELLEYPFTYHGMTYEEFDEEIRYFAAHQTEYKDGTYMPLWKQQLYSTISEWATENIKEAPFWVDGMTPQEYDREREYYLRNFKKIRSGEMKYNKFEYKTRK